MRKLNTFPRCRKLLFVVVMTYIGFIIPENTFAQQTVSGTIKDASTGTPLTGATVSVKGGRQNTVTGNQGEFTITVPDNNSILIISYVGYVNQEVIAGSGAVSSIALVPSSAELTQVVVVGYGTQNKKDITGAIKSLKSESFNKGIINSPLQLLQGKVSGVKCKFCKL